VEAFVEGLNDGKPADAAAPASAPARLVQPVQGELIRRVGDDQPGGGRSHGWTWRTAPGAAVLSPAPARIDYAGPLRGWGSVLILNIGGGRRLVLAGLDTISIGVGRAVSAGEPVGRLAENPGPSPPELYLEVRDRDGAENPGRWLQAEAHGDDSSTVRR
jgi:septal ring factor EnvC (AmiA/AmiB activator)